MSKNEQRCVMMEEENVDEVAVEFVYYDNNRLRVSVNQSIIESIILRMSLWIWVVNLM